MYTDAASGHLKLGTALQPPKRGKSANRKSASAGWDAALVKPRVDDVSATRVTAVLLLVHMITI